MSDDPLVIALSATLPLALVRAQQMERAAPGDPWARRAALGLALAQSALDDPQSADTLRLLGEYQQACRVTSMQLHAMAARAIRP